MLRTIPQDAKLPSIRALTNHMGISRNPVEIAYTHLVSEGYIINKQKSGFFAAPVLQLPLVVKKNADFAYDRIQSSHFPLNAWKKLTQRTLQDVGPDLFSYGDRKGELQLHRLIQAYVR